MQLALNAVRGYSDFFISGFRTLTNRARGQTSSSDATPKTTGATKRRPRPVSMIVHNTPRQKARRRRSSFLSFSSHFLSHKSTAATPTFNEKSSTGLCTVDSEDSLPEFWITSGAPYTLSGRYVIYVTEKKSTFLSFLVSPNEVVYIDPFCSSPDAKSTFMDFLQDDSSVVLGSTPKRLSLPSSSNHSSITKRERPSSVQTLPSLPPLPSQRSSSLQYHSIPHRPHHYPLGQEKSDFFWVVEEDMLSLREVEDDAPANIDWRQFHFDILTNDM